MKKIQSSDGEFIYPVKLVHPKENGIWKAMDVIYGKWRAYLGDGSTAHHWTDYEARGAVATYLEMRDDPNMKVPEDIMNFNIEHADLELSEGNSTRRHPLEHCMWAYWSIRLPKSECHPGFDQSYLHGHRSRGGQGNASDHK